jgi:hypothetical protein
VFAFKKTFEIFIIQIIISLGFLWEFRRLNNFQEIDYHLTTMRIIFCFLLQKQFFKEMSNATKILVFLKRMKGNVENTKGRNINIFIISLQIIAPIILYFVNIIVISQTDTLFSMLKHYVAIGFIMNIDNLFSTTFPRELIENTDRLNASGLLKMPEDKNTARKILSRLCRKKYICKLGMWT